MTARLSTHPIHLGLGLGLGATAVAQPETARFITAGMGTEMRQR